MFINSYKLYKKAEKDKEGDIVKALEFTGVGGVLLDCGCWDGKNTLRWAKAKEADKIVGIEISDKEAQLAQKSGIEVHQINLDTDKWPLRSASIDCVLSNIVIEHLSNVDHFISESYRVCKRNGLTIVSTNNLSSWHNIISLILGWTPFDLTNSSKKIWSLGNPLAIHKNEKLFYADSYTHKCVYTTKGLVEWYGLYGFKLVKSYGSGYYPLPSFLGSIDKTHAAYMTLVFKK